jgi:hypothetical protein
MPQHRKKLHAAYEDLHMEIYEFSDPEHKEPFVLPTRGQRTIISVNPRYDHHELFLVFPAVGAKFILWTRWPQGDNPESVVTYALHEGTTRDTRTKCLGHFNSDKFSPAQLVFYAALQHQLRFQQARADSMKLHLAWIESVKTDRPDVYATFRNENFTQKAKQDEEE